MKKRAFTLIEMLVVVAIIALLIAILLPSLSKARELSRQTVCGTNLKEIGTSLYIYQDSNRDQFPTAPHKVDPSNDTPDVGYVENGVGNMGGGDNNPANPARDFQSVGLGGGSTILAPTRSFWLMIRTGETVPKQFVCPSSDDSADPTVDVATYYDFIGFGTSSYGYQIPYDDVNPCKPSADSDPRMVLAADRGPWSTRSTERGIPMSSDTPFFRDGLLETALSQGLYDILTDASNPPAQAPSTVGGLQETSPPDLWKRFNSPNHGGEGSGVGQSVLFPDAHAEFRRTPLAGTDWDNIYTKQSVTDTPDADGGIKFRRAVQWGVRPDDSGDPEIPGFRSYGDEFDAFTDSLIWP